MNKEYIVFTDESYLNGTQFQGLTAFSFPKKHISDIQNEIKNILVSSEVSEEFKWKYLGGAKYYFCAEKFIDFIINNINSFSLRIDSLVWDKNDNRHLIQNRDDKANFERMFFHLVKFVLLKREKDSRWEIRPDSRSGIDWETIRNCLKSIGLHREFENSIFGDFFTNPNYHISSFTETCSKQEASIQICDLLSGLSVFSRELYRQYSEWKAAKEPSLFDNPDTKLSNSEKYRFELLLKFNAKCKKNKLGVSLDNNPYKGLYTYDHKNPINFWPYAPQGTYDKAPTK